jgi:hypothetical protein
MTQLEFGFVAMVVAALAAFAVTLAYASFAASGSPKQAAKDAKPANANAASTNRAA